MESTIENAAILIASEKIKDRQDGIARYREAFSDTKVLQNLPDVLDVRDLRLGKPCWISSFQSIFDAMIQERSSCAKSSSKASASGAVADANIRRVGELARLIAWMTDKAQQRIGRKTSRAILAHLTQTLQTEKGQVLEAILPHYLRALKTLLSWDPHAQHVDDKGWKDGVSVCWNLLLGDNPKDRIDPVEDVVMASISHDVKPESRSSNGGAVFLSNQAVSDAFVCLEALYRSCSAILVGSSEERFGIHLLGRYVRYFSEHRQEAASSLNTLTSLNVLVHVLQVNERALSTKFASIVWSTLLRLLETKSPSLKEQVLITFDLLLPLLATPLPVVDTSASAEAVRMQSRADVHLQLQQLQSALLNEPRSRSGLKPLHLDAISFRSGLRPKSSLRQPFETHSLATSSRFEAVNASEWLALEVLADTTNFMNPIEPSSFTFVVTDADGRDGSVIPPTPSGSRAANKRPRSQRETNEDSSKQIEVEDDLQVRGQSPLKAPAPSSEVVNRITKRARTDSRVGSGSPPRDREVTPIRRIVDLLYEADKTPKSLTLWALQALVFWMEKHPQPAADAINSSLLERLSAFLHDPEGQMASWATVALASASVSHGRYLSGRAHWAGWANVWSLVTRRVGIPNLSRASAHLGNTLIEQNLVDQASIPTDASTMIFELSSQAVTTLSDSLSELVCRISEIVKRNRASTAPTAVKGVMTLMQALWIPNLTGASIGSSAASGTAPMCYAATLIDPIAALCDLTRPPSLQAPRVNAGSSATAFYLEEKLACQPTLSYLLAAKLDTERVAKPQSSGNAHRRRHRDPLEPSSDAFQVVQSLVNTLKPLAELLGITDSQSPSASTLCELHPARLQHIVNLAVLAFLLAACVRRGRWEPSPELTSMACRILSAVLDEASSNRRNFEAKAQMFRPLAAFMAWTDGQRSEPFITGPTERSGVQHQQLAKFAQANAGIPYSEMAEFLQLCFVDLELDKAKLLYGSLDTFLSGLEPDFGGHSRDDSGADVMMDDDFGLMQVDESPTEQMVDLRYFLRPSSDFAIGVHITCTVVLLAASNPEAHLKPSALLMDNGLKFGTLLMVLSVFLRLHQVHLFRMDDNIMNEMLVIAGEEFLPKYQYSRDSAAHELTLEMMLCILQKREFAFESVELRDLCKWFMTQASKRQMVLSWHTAATVARMLHNFLVDADMEHVWNPDGECISSNHPISILQSLISSPDIRVRLSSASLLGGLFNDVVIHSDKYEIDLYEQTRECLPTNFKDLELVLSMIVVLSNLAILSPKMRHDALANLIQILLRTNAFDSHVSAAVSAVASQLGFSSPADMHQAFASSISYVVVAAGLDILQVPPHPLGYSSARKMAEKNLGTIGFVILGSGSPAKRLDDFDLFCKIARTTSDQVIKACRPYTAAFELGDRATHGPLVLQTILQAIGDFEGNTTDPEILLRSIQSHRTEIVCCLIKMSRQLRPLDDDDLKDLLDKADATCVTALHRLTAPCVKGLSDVQDLPEPPPPWSPIASIVAALHLLHTEAGGIFGAAPAYLVMERTFEHILSSKLVMDQLRCLRALLIFAAHSYPTIQKSKALLALLMRRSTALLNEIDLAPLCLSVLQCCFQTNRKVAGGSIWWLPCLIQTGHVIGRHLQASDPKTASVGKLCRTWLQKLYGTLTADASFADDAAVVFYFWPDALVHDLPFNASLSSVKRIIAALQTVRDWPLNRTALKALAGSIKNEDKTQSQRLPDLALWLIKGRAFCHSESDSQNAATAFSLADVFRRSGGHSHLPGAAAAKSLAWAGHPWERLIGLPDSNSSFSSATIIEIAVHFWHECQLQAERTCNLSFVHAFEVVLAHTRELKLAVTVDEETGEVIKILSEAARSTSKPLNRRCRNTSGTIAATAQRSTRHQWLTQLCECLLFTLSSWVASNEFLEALLPLVEGLEDFAVRLAPCLLRLVMRGSGGNSRSLPQELSILFRQLDTVIANDVEDWRIHRFVIDSVLYIQQIRDQEPDSYDLGLDLIILAKRSVEAGLFMAALLFIERQHEAEPAGLTSELSSHSTTRDLVHQIYSNVDDPDGFYSIPTSGSYTDMMGLMKHERKWQMAFELTAAEYEVDCQVGLSNANYELGGPLHEMGFNALAADVGNLFGSTHSARGEQYDISWQGNCWNLPSSTNARPGNGEMLYQALRAIRSGADREESELTLQSALTAQLAHLNATASEPSMTLNALYLELTGLAQLFEWHKVCRGSRPSAKSFGEITQAYLPEQSSHMDPECSLRILQVRRALLHGHRAQQLKTVDGGWHDPAIAKSVKLEARVCREICKIAASEGRQQIALATSKIVQKLEDATGHLEFASLLQFAHTMWSFGHHSIAQIQLEMAINRNPQLPLACDEADLCEALTQSAMWHSEARSEQPHTIEQRYFQRAVGIIDAGKVDPIQQSKVYHRFAQFASDQHAKIGSSGEVARLEGFVQRRSEELRQHDSMGRKGDLNGHDANEVRRYRRLAEAILGQDKEALLTTWRRQMVFLEQAMVMFAKSFSTSDLFDNSFLRFFSLWFAHADNKGLNRKLESVLQSIPSHKFILLTHQIVARLNKAVPGLNTNDSDVSDTFSRLISDLTTRICVDHPFHTLYALYAVRGDPALEEAPRRSSSKSTRSSQSSATDHAPSQRRRAAAADEVWNAVFAQTERLPQLQDLSLACDAYVEWAKFDLKAGGARFYNKNGSLRKDLKIPSSAEIKLSSLHDLQAPIATVEIDIDKTCEYKKLVTIVRYSTSFSTAGGLHLPKITTCIGTDGQRHKQLFKNEDDLRQDAIMQQVFRLVNGLLENDARARRRKLQVRTYIVRPLGEQWGLLQFVSDTKPIGELLMNLHEQYRQPGDITPYEGRGAMSNAKGSAKLKIYEECCSKLKPVFHHFFTDSFQDPMSWFSARLAYTRSVATGSIVGWVLGLGDRHVSNILIDVATGEMVHIDFGVAFEQGKLLPIPEMVPFRLTRDVVSGMGMPGVEGTFRHGCQETLRVLRVGTELIKTILEVFKYDPLFSWTSNPVKAIKAQEVGTATTDRSNLMPPDMTAEAAAISTAEISADRALQTVLNKLAPTLSIEYTVNDLIQEARNPKHLAAIFHGWQALL